MTRIKDIYDKENELVKKNAREAHKVFSEAINSARQERKMTINDLTVSASASPAQTYRVLTEPDANLSLLTMQRFAASVGKKVVLQMADLDEDELEM